MTAPARRAPDYPRLLVIDPTRIGSPSDANPVTSRLLRGWPPHLIRQVHADTHNLGMWSGDDEGSRTIESPEALAAARRFAPEVISVRPVAEPAHFAEFTRSALDAFPEVPLVVHVMDDWLEQLRISDPASFPAFDAWFRALLRRSSSHFCSSRELGDAFWKRYGVRFKPMASVVEPSEALELRRTPRSESPVFTIKHSGGIETDMNAAALLEVARAVERLGAELPVSFQLRVPHHRPSPTSDELATMQHVTIDGTERADAEHRRWRSDCDLIVFAYDFAEASRSTIGYSLEPEFPDCLAAGRPILAYGPGWLPTIRMARESGGAVVVDEQHTEALYSALRQLATDRKHRETLSQAGIRYALAEFDGLTIRKEFHRELLRVAGRDPATLSHVRHAPAPDTPSLPATLTSAPKAADTAEANTMKSLYPPPAGQLTPAQLVRSMLLTFRGRSALPLLLAALVCIAAAVSAAVGASPRTTDLLLALGGLTGVVAVAATVVRLRREHEAHGHDLEVGFQQALTEARNGLEVELSRSRDQLQHLARRVDALEVQIDRRPANRKKYRDSDQHEGATP